jgi:hypothetical protein
MNNNKEESKEYFKKYFDEIVSLNTKYKILIRFREFVINNHDKIDYLKTVYLYIIDSLQTDIFISLSRIYEIRIDDLNSDKLKEAGSRSDLNIVKLLIHLRKDEKVDEKDIEETVKELKKNRNIIKKILVHRDKFYAHFDREYFCNSESLFKNENITWNDLKKLIELAGQIINKYSDIIYSDGFKFEFTNLDDRLNYLFKKLIDNNQN